MMPTIAFRTLAEAQHAPFYGIRHGRTTLGGEVLIMMPLKKAVRADEGSSASLTSPRHPPAWDEQVRVDVCEVDVDDTYAFRAFVHKEVDVCLVNNQLQRAWAL
jgi:hypothetical protein